MASVIRGEWTHRRADAGGTRSVPAEIDHPRPVLAWSWRPEHGGRVDQLRVTAIGVVVATMMLRDENAPGWEHAVIYVLDAMTGAEVARRVLPDPVPVAAMVVHGSLLHVIATRTGEPIFWYTLSTDLVSRDRRVVSIAERMQHEDILDAWATDDGGLWLEIDATVEGASTRTRAYAFADSSGTPAAPRVYGERLHSDGPLEHDACVGARELFVPVSGCSEAGREPAPAAIARLDPFSDGEGGEELWVRASVAGPRARIHTLYSEGLVCAVTTAEDPNKPERAHVEAFAVEAGSGTILWRTQGERVDVKPRLGDAARIARRPNGEILFQSLGLDGTPFSPLICVRPDGRLDSLLLGARGPYVLDAALGDLVLGHRENKDGRVEVAGFAIDHEGRLLGRRALASWTIDAGSLGGGTTVYAGAGAVVVRGTSSVCAITL